MIKYLLESSMLVNVLEMPCSFCAYSQLWRLVWWRKNGQRWTEYPLPPRGQKYTIKEKVWMGVDQKRKLKQSLCTVLSGSAISPLSKSMWMGRLGDDMVNKDRLPGGSNY